MSHRFKKPKSLKHGDDEPLLFQFNLAHPINKMLFFLSPEDRERILLASEAERPEMTEAEWAEDLRVRSWPLLTEEQREECIRTAKDWFEGIHTIQ